MYLLNKKHELAPIIIGYLRLNRVYLSQFVNMIHIRVTFNAMMEIIWLINIISISGMQLGKTAI